jgi:hypothetical protein
MCEGPGAGTVARAYLLAVGLEEVIFGAANGPKHSS